MENEYFSQGASFGNIMLSTGASVLVPGYGVTFSLDHFSAWSTFCRISEDEPACDRLIFQKAVFKHKRVNRLIFIKLRPGHSISACAPTIVSSSGSTWHFRKRT